MLPLDTPVTITLRLGELDALRNPAAAGIADLQRRFAALEAENLRLSDTLQERDATINALEVENAFLTADNINHRKEITALLAELAALKAPEPDAPPVVVPDKPAPAVLLSRNLIEGVAMVTITKDNTPSPKQDTITRELLTLCKDMGFTHWRGLLNFEEIKSTASLPAFGRECGMEFIADTVDSQVALLDDTSLKTYFSLLKKHGTRAVYFNDVDDPKKTLFIQDWVDRARRAMRAADFDVPLIGSFTATFDRDSYPGFDHYEIQCFGTPDELRRYLANESAAIYCLDGHRPITAQSLKVNSEITLKAHIPNLAFYTAFDYDGTDWRRMPAQVAEIKDFLQRWHAAR